MAIEPQSSQSDGRIAGGLTALAVFCVLLILLSLFLIRVQPFIFLFVMTLGLISGILYYRRQYPTWKHIVKANQPWRNAKRSAIIFIGSFLLYWLFAFIIGLLNEPLKNIFSSIVIGLSCGITTGCLIWAIGLYVNSDKSKSPS
jgi:hypothetical protein